MSKATATGSRVRAAKYSCGRRGLTAWKSRWWRCSFPWSEWADSSTSTREIAVAQVAAQSTHGVIFGADGVEVICRHLVGRGRIDLVELRGIAGEDPGLHGTIGGAQRLVAVLLLHVVGNLEPAHGFDLPLRRAPPHRVRAPDHLVLAQALDQRTHERGGQLGMRHAGVGEAGAELSIDVAHAELRRDVGEIGNPVEPPGLLELRQLAIGQLEERP